MQEDMDVSQSLIYHHQKKPSKAPFCDGTTPWWDKRHPSRRIHAAMTEESTTFKSFEGRSLLPHKCWPYIVFHILTSVNQHESDTNDYLLFLRHTYRHGQCLVVLGTGMVFAVLQALCCGLWTTFFW
jgi:hypothetical protein